MTGLLHISDAASLALHAMVLIAGNGGGLTSTHEIAQKLGVSENHLAKVRQTLGKAGLVESTRGPHGGFRLARPASEITLLHIYEAVEGPVKLNSSCLLGRSQPCDPAHCILRGLNDTVTKQVLGYFAHITLGELNGDSCDK